MLTRLGEAGADAFTIPGSLERAFERLEALNGRATEALLERSEIQPVATNPPTTRVAPDHLPS